MEKSDAQEGTLSFSGKAIARGQHNCSLCGTTIQPSLEEVRRLLDTALSALGEESSNSTKELEEEISTWKRRESGDDFLWVSPLCNRYEKSVSIFDCGLCPVAQAGHNCCQGTPAVKWDRHVREFKCNSSCYESRRLAGEVVVFLEGLMKK